MKKIVQTPAIALYSPLSAAATSARVTPYPVDLDGTKLTMSDFGDIGYCTIDPKVSTFEEIVSFTGLTDNGDGTGTLTGLVRNLISKSPYTTPGTGKQHGSSAKVVFSNNPQKEVEFPFKANPETITGDWVFTGNVTFSNFPVTPSNSDASTTVKGVLKLSVAPVLNTNPVGVGDNDIRVPGTFTIDAAGTDSYAINPAHAITAYVAGMVFTFQAGTANTAAATLNVSGLGAIAIKKRKNVDLITGDIVAGQLVMVQYDGANNVFQLLSPGSNLVDVDANGWIPIANNTRQSAKVYVTAISNFNGAATTSSVVSHNLGQKPTYVRASLLGNNGVTRFYFSHGVAFIDAAGVVTYQNIHIDPGSLNANNSGTDALTTIEDNASNTKKVTISAVTTTQITFTFTLNGSLGDTSIYLFEIFV